MTIGTFIRAKSELREAMPGNTMILMVAAEILRRNDGSTIDEVDLENGRRTTMTNLATVSVENHFETVALVTHWMKTGNAGDVRREIITVPLGRVFVAAKS
jgi:hypothetical protein